ncbi:unnamed protein product [Toxocara canis]|uniref:F-box/LRR-repeat protein n=1 Tax=Toxocara canis TaxID=6265 RepID=A0A183TYD9_TOXCA|nr:unnamed protein product [Toxocara canis]
MIRLLESCPNLHTFHLCFHPDVNLSEISSALPTSLISLKTNGCPVVCRDLLHVLKRCSNLSTLSFTCTFPMHSRLGSFPNLQTLQIDGAIGANQPIHAEFIGSFPNVRRLEIAAALASRELICSLAAFTQLEKLTLSGAHPYVSDPEHATECVDALSTLPSLASLDVERNDVLAYELVARICDFRALENLNLSFTAVTRDLNALSACGFRSCTLRSLLLRSFSGTHMENKATQTLRHLTAERFPCLEHLRI